MTRHLLARSLTKTQREQQTNSFFSNEKKTDTFLACYAMQSVSQTLFTAYSEKKRATYENEYVWAHLQPLSISRDRMEPTNSLLLPATPLILQICFSVARSLSLWLLYVRIRLYLLSMICGAKTKEGHILAGMDRRRMSQCAS